MTINRREFIKANAIATAAAVAGVTVPASASDLITSQDLTKIKWDKAPCRFCGTGCSVNVGVMDGKVVATHGDIKSPVNKGLNCVKGYFYPKSCTVRIA